MKLVVLSALLCAALTIGCGDDDDNTHTATAKVRDAGANSGAPSDDAKPDAGQPVLTPVAPAELYAELQHKDFLLINVHIPDEGEIAGTDAHIAYNKIDKLTEFIGSDLSTRVVLYCLTNAMSTWAGDKLVTRGYRAIRYLDGGMTGWTNAGYELK